jgi:hypothetical protein
VLEGLDRQIESCGLAHPAVRGDLGGDPRVVGRIDHHGDARVVLGRGAQQGRAADVDVLDGRGQIASRIGDRLLEGIEIHDHQVDRLDLVLAHDPVVDTAPPQDAPVDARVQRLDPTVHHLREPGVVRDLGDGDALFGQESGGPAGGEDLDTFGGQVAGEGGQTGLVGHADEGAVNGWHVGRSGSDDLKGGRRCRRR